MKLFNIYGNHQALLSEEHGNFLMNLDVTLALFNKKLDKGWSTLFITTAHKDLKEIISFYIHDGVDISKFSSVDKYVIEFGLNANKEIIDTRLIYDGGRDRDFEQFLVAQGMQECIDKLIEEISK